jgi:gliding motility-associated-like protein
MRFFLIAVLSFLFSLQGATQDFSNKGTEFWVGYGSHVGMYNTNGSVNPTGGAQNMVLYFTSDRNANVKVEIPALGWSQNYVVTANQVTTSSIMPKTVGQDSRITDEGKSSKGIHITSDVPIIAYAHIYNASVSGATLLFPVNTLAREYYSINYKQVSNQVNSYCFSYVIATEDDTNIEIIPSVNTFLNSKGDTIRVNLNKGEIYNIFGRVITNVNPYLGEDLTGTKIRSVATPTSPCKRIAVFSGSGKVSISCNNSSGSADNYMQQAFPANAWGKKYLTAPTKDMPNNFFRIAVSKPGTIVKRNGVVLTGLNNGFYYDYQSSTPDIIESDEPIMVAQYITTTGQCGNTFIGGRGDPEMIYLSPVEQTIDKVTINSTPNAGINLHYINIVIHKNGASSLKIDGAAPFVVSNPHPQESNYIYYQVGLSSGSHTIQSDSGFNAIAYGYGNTETYGYNAGTNVKDLYQTLSTNNQFATVKLPATCKGTPFNIAITLPYQPLSLEWKVPQYPAIPKQINPVYDSTYVLNGKTIYRYTLNGTYKYTAIGTYNIRVLANNPTTDGCSGEQQIDFDLQVYESPKAGFQWTTTNCLSDSILIQDTSTVVTRPITRYMWDLGDGNFSNIQKSFKHKFDTAGKYKLRFYSITDVGCLSDTASTELNIDSVPIPNFGITSLTCQDKDIQFTDSSKALGGATLSEWRWDLANGTPVVNNTNASVFAKYANAQQFTVGLKIKTTNGCLSPEKRITFTNHPTPKPNFGIPVICLPDGNGRFIDSSSIADATISTLKYKWFFGDPNANISNPDTSIQASPIHKYSGIGPYNVKLILTSENGCIDSVTKSLNTIYAQPKANFNVTAEVCLRESTVFNDLTNAQGRTMQKWNWSFSNGKTDSVNNPVLTVTAAGTYSATLFGYTADGCVSDTLTKSFVINPLPDAQFNMVSPACETESVRFIQQAVPNVGSIVRWNWRLGDASTAQDFSDSTVPVSKIFSNWGDQVIRLMVENSKGCKSDTLVKTFKINPKPKINFGIPIICLPDGNALFSDSSSIADGTQAQFSYSWKFGDPNATVANPNTSLLQSPSHRYSGTGPYTAKLVVTSNNGCVDSLSKSVNTIYAQPKVNFSATEVCLRESTQFNDLTNPQGRTMQKWRWSFSNGKTDTVKNPILTVLAPGTYNATLFGFTADGCVSDTVTKSFVINPLPTPQFSMVSPACETESVAFIQEAVANVGTIKRWNWKLGASSANQDILDANTAVTKIFSSWGDQVIRLMVENSKGCKSDTLVRTVRINPKPKVGFSLPEVCLNDAFAEFQSTTTLADSSQTLSYQWDFGDPNASATNPNTGVGATIAHKYSAARNYTVILKATSSVGCISSLSQSFTVNGATPKADFAVLKSDSLCSNTNVSIQNLSSVDFGTVSKLEIYWDYLNNPSAFVTDDNPTPNKIYSNLYADFLNQPTKTFNIRVRAYSGGTCVDDDIKTITLNGSPLVAMTPLQGICLEAQPRRLNEASYTDVSGISAGSENFTGAGVSSTGIFNPASAGAGTHLITYRFTSSKGCFAETKGNIIVWPRPVADFTVANITCEKNAIVFTNKSVANAGTIVTWNWNFGDGSGVRSVNNGNAQSYTYSVYNTYNSSLDVVTSNGCTSEVKAIPVKVNPLPVVAFDMPKVCLPEGKAVFPNKTDMPDGSGNLLTYKWTYGDPRDPTPTLVKDGIHYFSALGSYNIRLVATSNNGCVDSLTKILTDVFPQPKAGFRSVDSVCLGKDIQYLDTSKGFVRPIEFWNWDFGNGATDTQKNPVYQHRASGTYTVSLWVKSSEGCISDTASKQIIIHPYPKVSAGPDLFVLDDGQKQIMATATGSALVYKWTPPNYLSNTNILQPIVTMPQQDIVYTLSVTGRGACTTTDDVAITVLKLPKPPNTFTPNGDGINDLWDIKYLDQYPGCILEVYSTQGQLVFRSVGYVNKWDGTSNGRPLPFGTYYYVIDPKSGRSKIAGYVTIIK